MVDDPIRSLLLRQLDAWSRDPHLGAGHLYLVSRANSLDVEVHKTGELASLGKDELKELLGRALTEDERPGFEIVLSSGQRGHVYPLRQDSVLQGLWVLVPRGSEVDWAGWTRSSLRFSEDLFALRQAGLGNPPTFRQLVETFPEPDLISGSAATPPLHWERSQSRVAVATDDDLSSGLLVDHLPLF